MRYKTDHKSKELHVRFDQEMFEAIKAFAGKRDTSVSEAIRLIIIFYFEAEGVPKPRRKLDRV